MLRIENVFKSFGDKKVLTDVSLTLPSGSIYGLVGINGSGKSTLLRIVSGVYMADSGRVLFDGKDVLKEPKEAKKDLFFLNDDPTYPSSWKAGDLISFYSCFYPSFDKKVFEDILSLLSLDASKRIGAFSKGMKRQLFVALAFATRAKTILLDEAFDGLDPLARLRLKRILIEETTSSGLSCIISSHSLRELEDIADRFGILDGGRLVDQGSLEERERNFAKFQLAFDADVNENFFAGFDVLSFRKNGKVIELVLRGQKEKLEEALRALHPLFLEPVDIRFEDLFLLEVENKEKEVGR